MKQHKTKKFLQRIQKNVGTSFPVKFMYLYELAVKAYIACNLNFFSFFYTIAYQQVIFIFSFKSCFHNTFLKKKMWFAMNVRFFPKNTYII